MTNKNIGSTPSVTVVVSARNEAKTIERCIESLIAQRRSPERIVMVNDGSTDETAQVLEQFADNPQIRVINLESNIGVPGARNIGVTRSTSDIIAFTDADAYATPGWLEELLVPFSDPAVVASGGPDRAPRNDEPFALAVDHSLRSLVGSVKLRVKNEFAPYSPAGCNLAIRRAQFKAAGGFDERLDRRGEEKELIQRLRRDGGKVAYRDKALIWHHRRVSPRQFWRQTYLSGKARVDILRLAPDAFAWPFIGPALMVVAMSLMIGGYLASGHPLLLVPLAGYLAALLADGLAAWRNSGSFRVAMWVPVTSGTIHWAYGIGLLVGAYRWLTGSAIGSGKATANRQTDDLTNPR